jgi:hypothetical protein
MATRDMAEDSVRIRVDAALKQAFEHACHTKDESMSQAIRRFMREYVIETTEQRELFERAPSLRTSAPMRSNS